MTGRARGVPPPVPPEARLNRARDRDRDRDLGALKGPTETVGSSPGALGLPISPEEINRLVMSARGGDHGAFTRLVLLFRPRIVALALHLSGSRTEAEDIAQDVFLRAFQCLGEFEGRSAFFTWLYRIALNRSLQARQKQRIRVHVDMDDPRVSLAIAVDALGDAQRAIELRETYTQLVRAFDQLSALLRTTVVLCTLQGLSYPEAAVVLGTTEGTIAWRMHESRNQLRRSLGVNHSALPSSPSRVEARGKRVSRESLSPELPEATCPESYTLAFALASVMSV